MPQHPGSAHNPGGGGSGFIPAGPPSQGPLSVPQGVIPTDPTGGEEILSELLKMLKGGQVGADRFMEVLGLLARQTLPNMDQGPQGPQGPQQEQQQIPQRLG